MSGQQSGAFVLQNCRARRRTIRSYCWMRFRCFLSDFFVSVDRTQTIIELCVGFLLWLASKLEFIVFCRHRHIMLQFTHSKKSRNAASRVLRVFFDDLCSLESLEDQWLMLDVESSPKRVLISNFPFAKRFSACNYDVNKKNSHENQHKKVQWHIALSFTTPLRGS